MNAYEQKLAQQRFIGAIRETLPAGYGASSWSDTEICIEYSIWGVQDSTQRYFVSNTEEWEALKPTLGRHTDEVMALLEEYGNRVGGDLSRYLVYGSPMRPMSASWARIEGAVYMQVDKAITGYHTYIATPLTLPKELVDRFELVFVSR